MAIIPHRFLERLTPSPETGCIKVLVIGTFNPGLPLLDTMSKIESENFQQIKATAKFRRFNQVKNYYDRPQNRFWKIMDVINSPQTYQILPLKAKNPEGLKFYSGLDRVNVFRKQQLFCEAKGLFITDIVRSIDTSNFDKVYNNFADSVIDKCVHDWNTDNIAQIIDAYQPKTVIINFGVSKSIPNISKEVERLKHKRQQIFTHALSTSGAAGNTYDDLVEEWQKFFPAT